jgi:hypothetical protein
MFSWGKLAWPTSICFYRETRHVYTSSILAIISPNRYLKICKKRHHHKSIFDSFRLFLCDSGGSDGLVLCGILFPSKLDHYDFWSRPGGFPMITFRFMLYGDRIFYLCQQNLNSIGTDLNTHQTQVKSKPKETNQQINQPPNQPANQPTNQPTNHPPNQPTGQRPKLLGWMVGWFVGKPQWNPPVEPGEPQWSPRSHSGTLHWNLGIRSGTLQWDPGIRSGTLQWNPGIRRARFPGGSQTLINFKVRTPKASFN